MMGLRYRKRMRLGPLPAWINIARSAGHGWTWSWSVRLFGVTYNGRTKKTADLPGGWSWHEDGRPS